MKLFSLNNLNCYLFQPRYNTPDSSPAKKFAENTIKPPKKSSVSPVRGSSAPTTKRKSPSKLVPVIPLKRVRSEASKKSRLLTSEKKTELVPPGGGDGVKTGRDGATGGRRGKKMTSVVKSKKSKMQTAASNTVRKALKIGRAQLNMRATRATTAAIEEAKLQQEQRKAVKVKSYDDVKPDVKYDVKSDVTLATTTPPTTTTPIKEKSTKDKTTPHKSFSERKVEKHKPSPLKTRSTSKLEVYEREAENKMAKKRTSEGNEKPNNFFLESDLHLTAPRNADCNCKVKNAGIIL